MESRDKNYKQKMLALVTEKQLNSWLKKNPPPPGWPDGKYAWAYTEMRIGLKRREIKALFSFFTSFFNKKTAK